MEIKNKNDQMRPLFKKDLKLFCQLILFGIDDSENH